MGAKFKSIAMLAAVLSSVPCTAQVATNPSSTQSPSAQASSTQASQILVPQTQASPDGSPQLAQSIRFNFKNAQIDSVLDYMSKTAGFVIIKEVSPTGTVTVLSEQPVTPTEAVALLNSLLKVNGATAIQMGRVLRITSLDKAKKSSIPVYFGADPAAIAPTDDLITQVIPVRNVDAVKLKTDLTPLVSTEADLSANAASNTLLMTDTSANVRRIVQIVSSLDKREASQNSIAVRQLKYADATAAAKLVNDIFNPQTQQQNQGQFNPAAFFRFGGGGPGGFGGGGGGGGGGFRGGPGGPQGPGSTDTGNTGKVQASSDTRTNTVVVSGPPDTLDVINKMLDKLDANPAEEQTFFIYHVKNGQAVDMANTLNGLFSGSGSSPSTTANRSQFSSTTGNRISGSNSFGGGSLGGGGGLFGGSGGGFGGGGFGGGGSGSQNSNRGLSSNSSNNSYRPGGNTSSSSSSSVFSDLVGQVYVVADQDTNSLLIASSTKVEQRVRAALIELDRRVPQVLIKVLIAEVTHDNTLDLGSDFSTANLSAHGNGEKVSGTLGAAAAAASASTPAGFVTNIVSNDFKGTLQALAQENKLDVLSRPYILTSDNQEADITVGSEIPFITNTYVDANGGTHSTPTYQNIGIILTVTPHINPEGLVTMLVSPQISSLTDQTVTIQQGVTVPVIQLRSADSYLTVRDGQTVVIGGLMQDQKRSAESKIPLLGDIPYIGKILFSYGSTTKTKTELLIFLTPHVALDPDRLVPMSQDEVRALKLTPNAVDKGTFREHLEGLRRGGTSSGAPAQEMQAPPENPKAHQFELEPKSPQY